MITCKIRTRHQSGVTVILNTDIVQRTVSLYVCTAQAFFHRLSGFQCLEGCNGRPLKIGFAGRKIVGSREPVVIFESIVHT